MINKEKYFRLQLLQWNVTENNRPMPWKGEKDPYKIWLSEIILQQTRVEQGRDYYERFVKAFPTIQALANAPEKKIFKLWEGLGYYTRCKNIISTARFIVSEKQGIFPQKYDEILSLKGVGPYTAAAIASFAYDLPHAVVDGNVFRVLARYFGDDTSTDSTAGKKKFTRLATELIDKKAPGVYNQAIMDFGAVVCKPKSPQCGNCFLKAQCTAHLTGMTNKLPVKKKSGAKRTRAFYYLVVEHNGKVYVRKRGKKDIWENLYEFILIETKKAVSFKELKKSTAYKKIMAGSGVKLIHESALQSQQLTHQIIQGRFIHLKTIRPLRTKVYKLTAAGSLSKLPFPKFIKGYISEKQEWPFG